MLYLNGLDGLTGFGRVNLGSVELSSATIPPRTSSSRLTGMPRLSDQALDDDATLHSHLANPVSPRRLARLVAECLREKSSPRPLGAPCLCQACACLHSTARMSGGIAVQ